MTVGARLYEETVDLRGTGLHEVMEKLAACRDRARTPLAKWRLETALDEFIGYVHNKWFPPGGAP